MTKSWNLGMETFRDVGIPIPLIPKIGQFTYPSFLSVF